MKRQAFLIAVAAGTLLAACQTAPEAPPAKPAPEPPPVSVDLPAPPDSDEPRVNEWGGEVPENKPAGDVDEGTLVDIP